MRWPRATSLRGVAVLKRDERAGALLGMFCGALHDGVAAGSIRSDGRLVVLRGDVGRLEAARNAPGGRTRRRDAAPLGGMIGSITGAGMGAQNWLCPFKSVSEKNKTSSTTSFDVFSPQALTPAACAQRAAVRVRVRVRFKH